MPESWENCRIQWNDFLDEVAEERRKLNCSVSNAWFRGHSESSFSLLPSILRPSAPDKISADRQKLLDSLDAQDKEQARIRDLLLGKAKTLKREQNAKFLSNDPTYEAIAVKYRKIKKDLEDLEKAGADRARLRKNLLAVHYGERDAYIDFRFRSRSDSSSWEILAEMQHYRVPTRLLDWTEVLALAVYFALEEHVLQFRKIFPQTQNFKEIPEKLFPAPIGSPCIWILNPYHLAREALGSNSISDLTVEPEHDYYNSFFVARDWPHVKPIPSYSPWRNPRLAAQQGMFTVHGLSKLSLDEQCPDHCRKISISPGAAIYGTYHLVTFMNIDKYIMFRDADSLGQRIKERFICP